MLVRSLCLVFLFVCPSVCSADEGTKSESERGFVPLIRGNSLDGWQGARNGYECKDGVLASKADSGGFLYTEREYADFVLRFEFKLTPGGNNGIAIRAPLDGRISRTGMEIQVLDNSAEKYAKLKPWQYHGSIYGLVPAKRGFLKPVGEWNQQEILAQGTHIRVTLNGTVIVDADLDDLNHLGEKGTDGYDHPGRYRKSGRLGFMGHRSRVEFRNLRIKELPQDDSSPNIVLITADNLGYGDLGCYGNESIKTPHIDRLAEEGVRCTDFYVASPTCTCSRASLLTGRYPLRNGLTRQLSVEGNMGVGLRHSEILLPELLRPRGYATACFGKWNIGFAPGSRPTDRGFDEFFGHASGNMDYETHVYNSRNDLFSGIEAARVPGYSTDLFADRACEFIQHNQGKPFFVYLPFNAPHFPNPRNKAPGEPTVWQAPPEAFAVYGLSPDETDPRARYRAVVTALDSGVGRVLEAIDAAGLRERTIVIFFSDNGAFMLPQRGLEVASNAPLRDGGVTLYEGGIRVPCLVRWPGRITPGSVCREMLVHMDFFSMAMAVAGGDPPGDRTIDGRDPTAALALQGPSPHEALYFDYGKYRAMRQGRYKMVQPSPDSQVELYDLDRDLAEQHNLADEQPDRVARMVEQWTAWRETVAED